MITTDYLIESFDGGINPPNWEIANNINGNKVTKCGDAVMLGGFSAFGVGASATKRYHADPKLSEIVVKFRLFAIDSWDSEIFYVSGNDV